MAAKKPVGGFESMGGVDNIRKLFPGKANGGAKVHHASTSRPVTKSDGYSMLVILFKFVDIFFVLYNICSKLFFESSFNSFNLSVIKVTVNDESTILNLISQFEYPYFRVLCKNSHYQINLLIVIFGSVGLPGIPYNVCRYKTIGILMFYYRTCCKRLKIS